MGNEQSKKTEPLPHISRRDYHAPFPPKPKIDYKDPRNFVLPKELPTKTLRPVKKKFEPIPGIPEEEENEEYTDTEIDRNSNLGSVQNLNFIGLNGSVESIDKLNSVANGFTLGNGVVLNGHAPVIGNGDVAGRQKKKNPAPPPPPPPPPPHVPGTDVHYPHPYLTSQSNSTSSLNSAQSQAQSHTSSNHSADDKTKTINGNQNMRRFSDGMKNELIEQVRTRMKRPPKKQEPIEKPKTPLEIFQSELASVSARMEEKRASRSDWNAFEKKPPPVIDVGHKFADQNNDDVTLGAAIQILPLNKQPNGRIFRKKDEPAVAHARSHDWVPEHDLGFEENKDDDHPIVVTNLSTDDEVMYRSGLQFKANEPSLGSARHYRSRSAEGEERTPRSEKREERKSSYSKYSNSLRAFKRNMQQMFNSLGKSSIGSKERGSVLDLFEDTAKLEDLDDELASLDEIDEEPLDLRGSRRVTFSPQPAQMREVVYYPGERDHRRFSEGYYPPMYAPRRPPPFDPWYHEAMHYPPPPYRYVVPEGPAMYGPPPDRRLLEMDYYHQMEDFHYYDPNSPSGMFYGRYGASTTPPTEKKKTKGKLSLRSRRRKLLEEARLKRQLAEEILKRDMRERQRMKNDKIQKKEYNANWEMLRDDIQYDSGLVSSRIRPNKMAKERIHHQRSRSAPAATMARENSVDSYWGVLEGDEGVMREGHARNVNFPGRTGYNEFEVREFKYGGAERDQVEERLSGDREIEDDITGLKNSRRRSHAKKQNGDVISSSSDENKPPAKVLKSVLDEFDDIINSVPRDYSSSSEDEAGGDGGLGSVVKTINTKTEKYGNQREPGGNEKDDVAL
ncbi:uncharacterized protein LOC135492781 [Lineus longissimus]|uniref:uncharacterized protein LOC135492781 n=1 Tax=Lineus longissimus TaxID=88925 RepID=UPI002B4E0DB2